MIGPLEPPVPLSRLRIVRGRDDLFPRLFLEDGREIALPFYSLRWEVGGDGFARPAGTLTIEVAADMVDFDVLPDEVKLALGKVPAG